MLNPYILWKNAEEQQREQLLAAEEARMLGEHSATPASTLAIQPFETYTSQHQVVTIRRVTQGDVQPISEMLRLLSERSRWQRYMTARPLDASAARHEAVRMVHGQSNDRVTLVATADANGTRPVVAIGELVRDPRDADLAECAIVVRDDMQNNGIGSRLLLALTQLAPVIGCAKLRADVLPENRVVQALIRKLGVPYTSKHHYGSVEFVLQVGQPDSTAYQWRGFEQLSQPS